MKRTGRWPGKRENDMQHLNLSFQVEVSSLIFMPSARYLRLELKEWTAESYRMLFATRAKSTITQKKNKNKRNQAPNTESQIFTYERLFQKTEPKRFYLLRIVSGYPFPTQSWLRPTTNITDNLCLQNAKKRVKTTIVYGDSL